MDDERPCLFMSSGPESNDPQTLTTVCYDDKKETVIVDWPQYEPVGIRLYSVMEVITVMVDVSPISL